jgi:hypothetical protein
MKITDLQNDIKGTCNWNMEQAGRSCQTTSSTRDKTWQ